VQEWEGGIYLAVNNVLVSPPVRTPPVKQLEAEMGDKTKDPWRSGKAMRVIIMARKAVWYAYTRRLYGHPLSPAAAAAAATRVNSGASGAPARPGGSSAGGPAAADTAAAGDAAAAAAGGGSSSGGSSNAAGADGSSSAAGKPPEEAITDLEVLAR
jgi:hypothetical protein